MPSRVAQRRAAIGTWAVRLAVLVAAIFVGRALRGTYAAGTTPGLEGQLAVRAFEVARTSFLHGDGFPTWDRSQCGGAPYLGNPDTTVLGALYAGVFGVRGDTMVRGANLLACIVAITGGFAWGRRSLLLDRVPAFLLGTLFAASGAFAFHTGFRLHFASIALLPWVLVLARMGETDLRAAVAGGAALAVMILEGGLYPIAFTLVALLVAESPRWFATGAGPRAVGRTLAIVLGLGLALSAVKLLPMLDLLGRYPRLFTERDAVQWPHFFAILGEAELNRPATLLYSADEYRGYVGPLALGMSIAGAGTALILKPRRWDLFLLLVVALVLCRGATSPSAPWVALSRLPLFQQLNVPSRWALVVDLAIAGAAAVALHEAMRAVKKPSLVAMLLGVAFLAAADPVGAARKLYKDLPQQGRLLRPDPPTRPHHLEPGLDDLARKAENPMRNLGTDSCYSLSLELPPPRGLRMGEVPQAFIDSGSISSIVLRQNEWVLDVSAPAATVVHLNQSFALDWKSSVGRTQRNALFGLDIAIPAGQHHIVVGHRPRGLVTGIVLTTLGALVALALLIVPPVLRRRAKKQP